MNAGPKVAPTLVRSALCRHVVAAACTAAAGAHAAGPAALQAHADEPRAYGWQVGDVLQRRIRIDVPDGLALDAASLPRPGARGRALELRAVRREASAGREDIELEYQVFLSPATVRTLEMPPLILRFDGRPRAQDLRIDAWPVTVAPLVPIDVSPRRGLGELQPDADAPPIATGSLRWRLALWIGLAALLAAALALRHFGLPWWNRRHRPFARAWPALRGLAGDDPVALRSACERLHAAFNASGGEVLFEHGVERFVEARPAFGALRADVRRFLAISRRGFFGDGAHEHGDLAWLVDFARRCRDAERLS